MSYKKLAIEFVTIFIIVLVDAVILSFLWNFTGHETRIID